MWRPDGVLEGADFLVDAELSKILFQLELQPSQDSSAQLWIAPQQPQFE